MKNVIPLSIFGLLLIAAHPLAQSPSVTARVYTPTTEVKASFLRMLDRPKVPLDVQMLERKPAPDGLVKERVDFAVERHPDGSIERVPALIVRPEGESKERMPAVIVLHGTGGTKEGVWPWLEELAHRGIVAIAIDGRFHGARIGHEKGTKVYNEAILKAYRSKVGEQQTHPFYYDTCWDAWRTIDYLQTRADVDPNRIGMIGISKGGIETWLAASVDERVKVAIPAISVQSFRWSLDHDRWQARANTIKQASEGAAKDMGKTQVDGQVCRALWAKVIPGILDEFDAPSMLRLFAGRSLLILNGEKDPNCPIEGAELAFTAAKAAFHDVDADDHLKIMVAEGAGHTVTPPQHLAALDWCVTWLKPTVSANAPHHVHFRNRALANRPVPPPRKKLAQNNPEHPKPWRRPFGQRAEPTPVIPRTLAAPLPAAVSDGSSL